jgi:hypothetical protein
MYYVCIKFNGYILDMFWSIFYIGKHLVTLSQTLATMQKGTARR